MLTGFLHKMNDRAVALRKQQILSCVGNGNNDSKILDLGCDDGTWTLQLKKKAGIKCIYGIDIVPEQLAKAREQGIIVKQADLNEQIPFPDNFFDIVHADQVIEHIAFLDNFAQEIYRILKPGGYSIISTENASSWHNIMASVLGWQIFSLTNVSSKKLGIGNPLAIHRGKIIDMNSWTHKTIFNYRGLKEFTEAHGFKETEVLGSGYPPGPAFFGQIDPRHAHYVTIKCYK